MKVEKHQERLPKVRMGSEELENVYTFVYLGAEIAADGDQQVTLKHRCALPGVDTTSTGLFSHRQSFRSSYLSFHTGRQKVTEWSKLEDVVIHHKENYP